MKVVKKMGGAVFGCLCLGILLSGKTTDVWADNQPSYEDGEIIVVFEEDVAKEQAEVILQTEESETIANAEDGDVIFAVIDLEEVSQNTLPMDVMEAVEYYSELPGVAYAQPNYVYEIEELTPEAVSSASNSLQWYWDYLKMNQTRSLMKQANAKKIRVAVIDTGVDISHPELTASINRSYSKNTCSDTFVDTTEDYGSSSHGTMVAGVIAADAEDGTAMSGMASGYAEICALQVQNQGGSITTSNVIRALNYAKTIDVKIVNMSMGMYQEDLALKNALASASDAGILIVCSAGNNATDSVHYPSTYDSTIGVIATNQEGNKYSSSNYGTDNFISAPGQSIYSTAAGGNYRSASGSSMAAAVACGIAADIWACNPDMSAEEVKQVLASTATDIYTSGFDAYSGWGIINPLKAIETVTGLKYNENASTDQDKNENDSNQTDENTTDQTVDEPGEIPNTTEGFVERLYRYCLGRGSDPVGMSTWVNVLNKRTQNGGEVAYGFLFSEEFLNKNLSDEQYVEILYRTFLNRKADAQGKATWMKALSDGMSRLYVMNGFSDSVEFREICKNCGFSAGKVATKENRDKNQGYTAYVSRLYTMALGRGYDAKGLNDWTGLLNDGTWSAYRVATEGFFHSAEFRNKNLSNEEFVKVLYRTFLGREYDETGLRDWLNVLNSGKSRDEVIAGFANSKEFRAIMAGYGL